MARDAVHLRKTWAAAPAAMAITPAVHVRPLCEADETTLGQLMWSAFHESADDADYGSPADARADARKALRGHWGPVCWEASLAAELEARMVAAVIVVRDDVHANVPLLAFVMTEPACQRRGIGKLLIEESIRRIDTAGVKELHLAVARRNPAVRLYQRLGFAVVP
jgi:GNAT superfamily N-acetyltransferase